MVKFCFFVEIQEKGRDVSRLNFPNCRQWFDSLLMKWDNEGSLYNREDLECAHNLQFVYAFCEGF